MDVSDMGLEKQVRLLALPLFDDAAVPTMSDREVIITTRQYLETLQSAYLMKKSRPFGHRSARTQNWQQDP